MATEIFVIDNNAGSLLITEISAHLTVTRCFFSGIVKKLCIAS
jgi:hypothetical protein